jgi:hypothetical protein
MYGEDPVNLFQPDLGPEAAGRRPVQGVVALVALKKVQ